MNEPALTFDQVVAIGRAIYGKVWIEPMANDLGYDNSTVYRWSAGKLKEKIKGPSPDPQEVWVKRGRSSVGRVLAKQLLIFISIDNKLVVLTTLLVRICPRLRRVICRPDAGFRAEEGQCLQSHLGRVFQTMPSA